MKSEVSKRFVARIFVVAAILGLGFVWASGAQASQNFQAGSLVVPMDTDTSANHAAYNQNNGMWKAYGLLYRLLANDVPVRWAIDTDKTATTTVDFTAGNVKDLRTNTALGSWPYRGGAFIIDSADAPKAKALITAWWSQNSNLPNVHEANSSFTAPAPVILRSPPRIANEAINSGISIAYYNAAGIPDMNGNAWTSNSPNILDQSEIAGGALFTEGECLKKNYDIFVTPHNNGYAYSLTDPSNLGTRTYRELDTFVNQGGGWTALCHSILSNENAFAALTKNGSPAVKAMFKTSLPGGKPGGLLTENGFSTISNTGGSWAIKPLAAKLPVAQTVPTTVSNPLPGGSVQTWPSSGPGAPAYWSQTERVASFTNAGNEHDNIIAGTYHDGTGSGKVTYIGGHSFATSTPFTANGEAPYLKAFYNSLFFNGTAKPQLEFDAPGSFPQNGTGDILASLKNIGGSTATNVNNVSIKLEPGFTYLGTTSGPAPSVSGQTLTWANLGDIPGGQSAVTVKLGVGPTVSSTTGSKKVGTVKAQYGDLFGEGFTGVFCRKIEIVPVPAPRLTKTPATQGPVAPGTAVTWTLTYGNTGAATLLSPKLEDTLPAGFTYVSSSSSPSVGSPTVIPGSPVKVRWSLSNISANNPSAGTVTITARAGAVTNGVGDPAIQTFTNVARLTGTDSSAKIYAADASAQVDLVQGTLKLDKSVDKAFVQTPGEVTYTLRPGFSANSGLENLRVFDPIPAGVTSPPVSIGQGGTFGAYVPRAAQPGTDAGPPVLDTSVSVSTNFRNTGQPVTVTLNVKSSTAQSGVEPEISSNGGDSTCGTPSPASANVPAGGSGVNFVWTCTPTENGEYTFSGTASNGTIDWPDAVSSSILVAPGGGPNVVTWNLGSTTDAVPGSNVTSGSPKGVFGLTGNNTTTFRKYGIAANAWANQANAPSAVKQGGSLTTDGVGTIWGTRGNGQKGFWSYNATTNAWTSLTDVTSNVTDGGAVVFLNGFVYALTGNGTGFTRYSVAGNSWLARAAVPDSVKKGGALTTDGTYVYALRGDKKKNFYRYDPTANTWSSMANVPGDVGEGGALTRIGGFIYALRGDNKKDFYRYNISLNTWTAVKSTPDSVKYGGALATDGTNIYALRGGLTTTFWKYTVSTNAWTTLPAASAAVGAGGALAYLPDATPKGRFTKLEVNRSLAVTGDALKVSVEFTADPGVNSINPGTLNAAGVGGASCGTLAGPVLTSADSNSSGLGDPVTYEWTCTVASGTNPGSISFSVNGSGAGPTSFPSATSDSAIVTPPLTFKVGVPNGAPNPVVNTAVVASNSDSSVSPTVTTSTGSPVLNIVKSNSPSSSTLLKPGDSISYTMAVENSGTSPATNVVVTDAVPSEASYVSCAGGNSCSESSGTVTWNLGTLNPGEIKAVAMNVVTRQDLPISSGNYTIVNKASVVSTQTGSTDSNEVTNILQVLPQVTKTASASDVATGQTVTFTVEVNNPGAPFTANVTDAVPEGTSFNGVGTCSPSCSFASNTVSWNGQSIPSGISTFSFDVTVTAPGGSQITNVASVKPTSPDIDPIPSNEVELEVGPALGIVKTNSPTGEVQNGDTITYTLAIVNESKVAATGVVVTDPVPTGTSYDSCSGGNSCSQASGVVTWQLGSLGAKETKYVSMTVTVGTLPPGIFQISNQASVVATNSPNPVNSNVVYNPVPVPTLQLTKSASPVTYKNLGDTINYTYQVTNNSLTSTLAGPVVVTDDKTSVTCPSGNLAPLQTIVCTASYQINQTDLNNGSVTNVARATVHGQQSNVAEATVNRVIDEVDLGVVKSKVSPVVVKTGDTVTYSVVVTNHGASDATGVTVTDDLPAGLTNVTADQGCSVGGGQVTCSLGDLANGASVTITVTGKVSPGQTSLVNKVKVKGDQPDPNPNNDQDQVTTPVVPVADLAIEKVASTSTIVPGVQFTYTFKVKNNGPDNATGINVSDTLPAGVSYVNGAPGCNAVGQVVTCTINFLAAGGNAQTGISVVANSSVSNPVSNTARVTSDIFDPEPGNNESTIETPVDQGADVQIVKTVNDPTPQVGDTITYTLTARNNGPAVAQNVVVTDQLPAGVTFVSASAPCTQANGNITCVLGDLDPGETVALQVKVKIDAWTTPSTEGYHGIDVQKVETQIDLEPGQVRTIQAVCPSGYFVSDGSVRIDHIDQGTGDWTAPEVMESRAVNNSTWQGTVNNTATGRAQAKIFAVCIRETTSPDGHGHNLVVSNPVIKTVDLANGNNEAVLNCPAGTTAIQPGFISDAPGLVMYSQPEGNGWKFVFKTSDAQTGDQAVFSIRCLSKQLSTTDGHSHDLSLQRIQTEQTIQPGQVNEIQLTCPDGSKGIVAGWDLDYGLVSLGNDPRPVTRAFKVYNPTDQPLKGRFTLLCLGDRTGTGGGGGETRTIVNTGKVNSDNDTDGSNNESSVTVTASSGSGTVDPGTGKPPVNNPIAQTIVGKGVSYSASSVSFSLKCSGACGGIAKLSTLSRVKAGGKQFAKGTVLAKRKYFVGKAGTRKIKLGLTRAGKTILKSGKAKKAILRVSGKTAKVVKVGKR